MAGMRVVYWHKDQCRVDGCDKPYGKNGLCSRHLANWKRSGNVLENPRPSNLSLDDKLMLLDWHISDTGCWEVSRLSGTQQYGSISTKGKDFPAHRAAYEAWVGPIPAGALIRHRCDNPPCINPEHLEPGTHAQNMNDMTERGRRVSLTGAENPAAQLTWDEVRDIRVEYAKGGLTQMMLADVYGVSNVAVSLILRGKTWKE